MKIISGDRNSGLLEVKKVREGAEPLKFPIVIFFIFAQFKANWA